MTTTESRRADRRAFRLTLGLLALFAALAGNLSYTSVATATDGYLIDADSIATGYAHSCAIRKADPADAAGVVVCWGDNRRGQLGDGTTNDSLVPVAVRQVGWTGTAPNNGLLDDAFAITANVDHTCAILVSGRTACWGYNGYGQLGDGTTDDSPVPVAVKQVGWTGTAPDNGLLNDAVAIDAGYYHTCAIQDGGQAICWGYGGHGQAGDGTVTGRITTPVAVKQVGWTGTAPDDGLLNDAVEISAANIHTCALRFNGRVACWGNNSGGQLGDGTDLRKTTPVAVKQIGWTGTAPDDGLLDEATGITASFDHTCVIRKADPIHGAGQAVCWGRNSRGQLGDGTTETRRTPVEVRQVGWTGVPPDHGLLDDAVAIAPGATHTCAIQAGGRAICWGDNTYGMVGDGTTDRSITPVEVKQVGWTGIPPANGLFDDATRIVASQFHTCGTQAGGQVACWGNNSRGQLGDGTTTVNRVPERVLRGEEVLLNVAVAKSGSGQGSVTSAPTGIDCGASCSADFEYKTEVTLTATPEPGSTFTGWSGSCAGEDPVCTVTATESRTVEAEFTLDAPEPPDPDPPVCPAIKLGFQLKGFKLKPPFGNSAKTSGLRVRVKTGAKTVMRIRPVVRYRLAGKKRIAKLKTRVIRVNGNRKLRFRTPKKMRKQFRRFAKRLPGSRVTFRLHASLRLQGTPGNCMQNAGVKRLKTRVVQVSGRAAISKTNTR